MVWAYSIMATKIKKKNVRLIEALNYFTLVHPGVSLQSINWLGTCKGQEIGMIIKENGEC